MDEPATTDQEILTECHDRLKLSIEAESKNRSDAMDDLLFGAGEQWESRVKQDRTTDNRPCLTVNLTDTMVRRTINACRENRPRIKVHPVSDGADKQTANVIDGLIRHIEYSSSADVAYDCGVEGAIRGGWGYIRLGADYLDPESFDQDLKIERVRNCFTVYPDPSSQTVDGSDYQWVIVSEMMARTEYKQRYGDIDSGGWQYLGEGDNVSDWSNKEQIRVAEYFRIVQRKDKLLKLSNGSNVLRSRLKDDSRLKMMQMGLTIVQERETYVPQLQWFKLNAHRVLDRRDMPGRYIPIVPVYGREQDLNGKVIRKGMIRDMKDPARIFNFAETAKAETYGLQPRAPWLGPEGFMDGHEIAWGDANRKPIVALEWHPTQNPDGSVAPPPQRQMPPNVAEGFKEWSESAQSNFLAVAGMPNDPGQDAKGEVVSGVAIRRRQGLSDISHYDFYDNLTRSLRHLGRIIIDVLPYYYDTPRMARIIGEDGTPQSVQLNEQKQEMSPQGQAIDKVKNDMTVGRYEVVVDTGPSYQTKREESADALLQLTATPKLGEMLSSSAGDLIVRSLDFPNSDAIADRLQSQIPAAQTDPNSDLPQKAQVMIAGLQQQLKQLGQQNLALHLELETKKGIVKMQEEGKTERERMWITSENRNTDLKVGAEREDTHVDAITRHDVAEIGAAARMMDSASERSHQKDMMTRELAHAVTQSEKSKD